MTTFQPRMALRRRLTTAAKSEVFHSIMCYTLLTHHTTADSRERCVGVRFSWARTGPKAGRRLSKTQCNIWNSIMCGWNERKIRWSRLRTFGKLSHIQKISKTFGASSIIVPIIQK